jgi:hypothetical protein
MKHNNELVVIADNKSQVVYFKGRVTYEAKETEVLAK